MPSTKPLADAKSTCDGLQRLVRKLNIAAVDLDKSGGSAYELIALLASTHTCLSTLSNQIDVLGNTQLSPAQAPTSETTPDDTNDNNNKVMSIHQANEHRIARDSSDQDNMETDQSADVLFEKTYRAQG